MPTAELVTPRISLGYVPRDWQRECHLHLRRFTVLALHRRAGKTELAIMQLVDEALRCKQQHSLFVYMAPFLKQAKLIAWDRIKRVCQKIPRVVVNESELLIDLPNGAKLRVFGGDNPDALRGVRLDGIVIDEVAQIKPEVWNEIVQPALSDRKGWALFIGTPKGINLFSELFHKAKALDDWESAIFTVYDTDALDPDEVARLRRDMPENEFRREYLCDFSAAAENQLIGLDLIEEASRRHLKPDQYKFAPVVVGVDPARFGDDKTAIVVRQGLLCHEPLLYAGLDDMQKADMVAQVIRKHNADAVFIDVGAGTGVIDRLRQLNYSVTEVNFGGRAMRPQFHDRRTEIWWLAKECLEQGGTLPPDIGFKRDLATPTYSYDAQNRYQLESKDDMKKRLLRSPDSGDAYALTFAMPVAPRAEYQVAGTPRVVNDYDPFDPNRRM